MKPRRIGRAIGDGVLGFVAPRLISLYVRFVHWSTRWQWEGRAHLDTIIDAREPVVFCFWHNRILLMCTLVEEASMPVSVLISHNRDGEIISRTIERFGATTIRGSTRDARKNRDKGGGMAFRESLDFLRGGGTVALTPDGPRGPRQQAQVGVAALSALAGLRTLPVAWSSRPTKILSGWDRFLLPFPFGKGAYVCGAPLDPPEDTSDEAIEAHRAGIEAALNAITARADALAGLDTPAPHETTV